MEVYGDNGAYYKVYSPRASSNVGAKGAPCAPRAPALPRASLRAVRVPFRPASCRPRSSLSADRIACRRAKMAAGATPPTLGRWKCTRGASARFSVQGASRYARRATAWCAGRRRRALNARAGNTLARIRLLVFFLHVRNRTSGRPLRTPEGPTHYALRNFHSSIERALFFRPNEDVYFPIVLLKKFHTKIHATRLC